MMVAGHCRPFNLTGFHVVTIPIGLDRDGLPIGVQIVGEHWYDERLLGIAKTADALTPRPPLPALGEGELAAFRFWRDRDITSEHPRLRPAAGRSTLSS
jgi:hypothetical protein